MNKKLLKVAVTTALTVAFAVPAFANPFSDVPAKHWAYDAVGKLAQAGVITGYGDGTFKGDKTVSRYEMASMIATAMQKNLNNDQKEIVDQLSKEFAAELTEMGVKVEALDQKVDKMVKISGDARVRYGNADSFDNTDFRARVSFDGKINNNLKFNARMTSGNLNYDNDFSGDNQSSVKLDTANVTFDALGLTNTIGRQDLVLGNGFLHDSAMTGLASQAGNLKVYAGNLKDTTKIYGAEYGMNFGAANITADYANYDDGTNNETDVYGANVGIKLTNSVTALGEFYNFDNGSVDANAAAYGLKFNKLGLTALYRDVEAGANSPFSNIQNDIQNFKSETDGYKGLEVRYDRALAKNTTLNLKYQDFENQNGIELDGGARTQAAINVKF
ncbi:S-layer homology domain-containing protein [Sporomusa sp.]|uniref:S-layer homology domain-containing protein n=1 Tax=Sporomusa sp. TaxID=2078658 RepID=UPI002BD05C8C|nr:S-layer homology domain-containing protein [Sporomusa sp.]HWR05924.1 S-layer homology domain-containing protein [Sporomusa sp.]